MCIEPSFASEAKKPRMPPRKESGLLRRFAPRNDGERSEIMNKPVPSMSSLSLKLPKADRSIETYRLAASRIFPARLEGTLNRIAFSAAHVVADPLAECD